MGGDSRGVVVHEVEQAFHDLVDQGADVWFEAGTQEWLTFDPTEWDYDPHAAYVFLGRRFGLAGDPAADLAGTLEETVDHIVGRWDGDLRDAGPRPPAQLEED